jgi:hypothetical protein
MNPQFSLTDPEVQLLIELLETERRELPPEIHHSDAVRVHDGLQERLKTVDNLIDKLKHSPVH